MNPTVKFLTPLRLENVSKSDEAQQWILLDDLVAEVDWERIVVPTGFMTDFASVPRLPLVYLAVGGIGDEAAVLHDWLYTSHLVSRARADAIFAGALEARGVSAWRRGLMWLGVRVGGAFHYGKGA